MKVDAITGVALAVGGLAVFAFAKNYRNAHPRHDAGVSDAEAAAWQAYGTAGQQRRENGAALSANTDYLRNWQALGGTFASQPDFYV